MVYSSHTNWVVVGFILLLFCSLNFLSFGYDINLNLLYILI